MNDISINIKNELIKELKKISEDKEFIGGVINNATDDDDRKAIIKYINNGKEVSYEQILLLSVWLDEQRNRN